MIYILVKDQVLSGMLAGTVLFRVLHCSESDLGVVRYKLKRNGFTILQEKDEPIEGHKSIDWHDLPRLNK